MLLCVRATLYLVRGEAVCKGAHPVNYYFNYEQQIIEKQKKNLKKNINK